LRSFITEQQSLEHEERTKEREFQLEKLRLTRAGSEFGGTMKKQELMAELMIHQRAMVAG